MSPDPFFATSPATFPLIVTFWDRLAIADHSSHADRGQPPVSGQRVAERVAYSGGSSVYFLVGDQLGSTTITTDNGGIFKSKMLYDPWGKVWYSSGTNPTNYTYTGQYSNTSDFGLMYYGARWYDPSLGRFAQADSIISGAGNPVAWDRYAYTLNNPVRNTDPTGHYVPHPVPGCTLYNDDYYCVAGTKNAIGLYGGLVDSSMAPPTLNLGDVKDPEGRNKPDPKEKDRYPNGYIKAAWENYLLIWQWLMDSVVYRWAIDPRTGLIKDDVIMSFIIAGEFGPFVNYPIDPVTKNSGFTVYRAALGALSNQYHRPFGVDGNESNIQCGGGAPGCTFAEQIGWLSDMTSWYNGGDIGKLKTGTLNWEDFLIDAKEAQHGIDSNYWMWGERASKTSVDMAYYTDMIPSSPYFVVHP